MSNSQRDETQLDPAQARIVQRLRRMMLFSSLLMGGGILAVFGVIGYRISMGAEKAAVPESIVTLPKGSRIVSTSVADGRIVVTVENGDATELHLFDLGTLAPRGTITLKAGR
jgi:hypothetical protein